MAVLYRMTLGIKLIEMGTLSGQSSKVILAKWLFDLFYIFLLPVSLV